MAGLSSSSNSQYGSHPGPHLDGPESIRLISLLPGTQAEDDVICELLCAELGAAPPYEALSYTWGSPSDLAAVSVRLPSTGYSGSLPVTLGCLRALRRLRLPDRARTLWIDAMCIDQANVPERNHQVGLMSRIYACAERVAIYLGEAAHDSDMAVDFLIDNDTPAESASYPRTQELMYALNSFFRRSWFTRVWVIQEVLLSQDAIAYCGQKSFPWAAIRTFHHWNTTERWLAQLPYVVSTTRKAPDEDNSDGSTSFLRILSQARHCQASNPRDKVYALLSLPGQSELCPTIEPNYSDTVTKVFTDCAVSLLDVEGFDVLSAVQGGSNLGGLPSWVPDWSLAPKRAVFGESTTTAYRRCSEREFWSSPPWSVAKGLGTPYLSTKLISLDGGKQALGIEVAGYMTGKIAKLGSTYMAGQEGFPLEEWTKMIKDDAVKAIKRDDDVPLHNRSYALQYTFGCVLGVAGFSNGGIWVFAKAEHPETDPTKPDGYWKSDDDPRATPQERFVRLLHETAAAMRAVGALGKDEPIPYSDIPFHLAGKEMVPSPRAYVQYVLRNCHSRRFLVTDTGYMGLAPADAEVGDQVYMFVGAGFPFIIRDADVVSHNGLRLRHLVGESYVEERAWKDIRNRAHSPADTITIV